MAFLQKGNLKTHIKRAHHLEMVQSMNIQKSDVAPSATIVIASTSVDQGQDSATGGESGTKAAVASTSQEEGIDLEGVVTDLFPQ